MGDAGMHPDAYSLGVSTPASGRRRATATRFPRFLARPGDDDRPRIMVLVADAIFGAPAIFRLGQAFFHERARPPKLLSSQVPAAESRFPLPLEIVQRKAALFVRASHTPRPAASHSAARSLQDRCHAASAPFCAKSAWN
jgi:hypothetical protein